MKIPDREITVTNRFIYYYANFARRIYGFILRRDGENLPDERYIGRLRPPRVSPRRPTRGRRRRPHPAQLEEPLRKIDLRKIRPSRTGRWGADPETDEILLFRYRKRLMLGYCRETSGGRISVTTEDRRQLSLRAGDLTYLTGIRVSEDRDAFWTYAASMRALSARIDLREVWDLLAGEPEPLAVSDIATLYWSDEIDASRWVALYLHLDRSCPYFESRDAHTCVPTSESEAASRQRQQNRRETRSQEWEEFVHWLSSEEAEPYDPQTLTKRQRTYLEEIRRYALYGSEPRNAARAREILSEVLPEKKDLQRSAFDLLVRKGIWDPDENLDLLRSGISLAFPADALQMAGEIDLKRILQEKGRKRLRRRPFSIRDGGGPGLAFSLKRRWRGGYELGVHIPDIAAFVPSDSPLDRAAADRLATVALPDREIPMLPPPLSESPVRLPPDQWRPALSLLWKLDKSLALQDLKIVPSSIKNRACLSHSDTETILEGADHPFGKALRILDRLTDRLRSERQESGAVSFGIPDLQVQLHNGTVRIHPENPEDRVRRIVHELAILASVETGNWCAAHEIPAIYEAQDPPENRNTLEQISDPTVCRHETRRQTPPVTLDAGPALHHGLGVSACCPVTAPESRYPDLMLQRQILHYLLHSEILHPPEQIDRIRYRAQEELREIDTLKYRRSRYWALKHLASSIGDECSAVVLYLRRDGALVELTDTPLKTVVHPSSPVSVGQQIRLQILGIDLWRATLHAAVL